MIIRIDIGDGNRNSWGGGYGAGYYGDTGYGSRFGSLAGNGDGDGNRTVKERLEKMQQRGRGIGATTDKLARVLVPDALEGQAVINLITFFGGAA